MTIVFGTSFTIIEHRWSGWKAVLAQKSLEPQFHLSDGVYTLYAYDNPDVHTCQVFFDEVPSSALTAYSQEQNDADKVEFMSLSSSWGKQNEKRQSGNKALLVAQAGREGIETIYATHNFCDPTSWFADSVRVEDAVLMGSGSIFSGSHSNWICMNRGSVLDEEGWKEDVDHGYEVIVIANGVPLTERDPLCTTGGDYVVNYESGSIDLLTSEYSPGAVTASYSYADGSTFYIQPIPYKKLDIEEVEAQFTVDVDMKDTIVFGVFGHVQVFAPQYWEGNGGPFPTNYKVELKRQSYKSMKQLIDEALGSYPVIPALGGVKRGLSTNMYGFPFRYGTVRTLYDSYGLEVRVWLQSHIPCGGERVSATFYCVASNEV